MKLRTLLIVIVLLAVAAFAAMPYYTAYQIRQAVQNGDSAALAQHVDFVAVRAGLKRQLADSVSSKLPDVAKSGTVGGLGAMLAGRVADAALESVVTPEGVSDLLAGRLPNPFDKAPGAAPSEATPAQAAPDAPKPSLADDLNLLGAPKKP